MVLIETMDYESTFDIVKQIGKGSFSNVYLCKYKTMDTLPLHISIESDDLFIIKEINVTNLVEKYTSNSKKCKTKMAYSPFTHNITPHNKVTSGKSAIHKVPYKNEDLYYYEKLVDLIEGEIDVLSMFNNQNVIKFLGSSQYQGVYRLKMEYCNEGDVYNIIKNKQETVDYDQFVYEFIRQVCEGVRVVHRHNIIHRDLKLHNILVQKNNDKVIFKLSDFGFSCLDLTEKIEEGQENDVLAKKYFKLCGTPYYMAPEIILNMKNMDGANNDDKNSSNTTNENANKNNVPLFYSKKVDMWSLGVCIFELVTNELPFPKVESIHDLEMFFRESPQTFIDNRLKKMQVDQRLVSVIKMLLQADPNLRASIFELEYYINKNFDKPRRVHHTLQSCTKQKTVVNDQVNANSLQSVNLSDSWEKLQINNSSSMIMKISVDKGFLAWLMNKK